MEALQKQQRFFTISIPLYLNFWSSTMKTVKVLLDYLLQLKYERVRLRLRLLADESSLRCESKNTM